MDYMDIIKDIILGVCTMIATGVVGWVGVQVKNLAQKWLDTRTKREVAYTCVQAVEQIYKTLDGPEKKEKAVANISEMLAEKGIQITELEIEMLLEAAVKEFNDAGWKDAIKPDGADRAVIGFDGTSGITEVEEIDEN